MTRATGAFARPADEVELIREWVDDIGQAVGQLREVLADPAAALERLNRDMDVVDALAAKARAARRPRPSRPQPCPYVVERRQRCGSQHERFEVVQGGAS